MRDEGIDVRATRWARHAVWMLALLALLLAAAWWVRPTAPRPLDDEELHAVVAEIDAMVKTPSDQVVDFVVREATPARIDRLYRSPAVAGLTREQRENGLIFAGRGPLLQFDAPSDIVRAVDRWFPQEMAQARQAQRLQGHLKLPGPYANWDDEPAAFLDLWNCMPQRAWLRPDSSPFDPEADRGDGYLGVAARSSNDIDIGPCLRERSGGAVAANAAAEERRAAERRQRATRTAPILVAHFAKHLAQRGCSGTGPDDCALVAWLWASLAPADPALAAALQKIAPEALATQAVADPDSQAGRRQRLLQGLRQAAMLKAQLTSLAAAPAAWPADALPQALRQLATLQAELDRARQDSQRNWSAFDLHPYSAPISPWPVLETLVQQPAGLAAVRAQITALPPPANADCQAYDPWTRRMPPGVLGGLALDAWRAGRPSLCVQPVWNGLRGDLTPEARQLYAALLALLPSAPGQVHEQVLSGLTNQGEGCFDENARHASAELQAVCRAWISEPGKVVEPLAHTGRSVQPADRFAALTLPEMPPDLLEPRPDAAARRHAWLGAQLAALGAPQGEVQALLAVAQRAGQQVIGLHGWRRADGQQHLVELSLVTPEPAAGQAPAAVASHPFGFGRQRVLLVIGAGQMQPVGTSDRLAFQYDEGTIGQVTDIDHDGRPEVWLSGSFGECDGDDLKPGIDCDITELHMGEVWGDTLSFFAWTPAGADTLRESRP
ncbi:hypothetical protein [Ideonella sp.]|uniref:hypothetical protein n=1 Tax=Ideonella sp. TaxID=1929293 RepID=UPI0035B44701